MKKPKRTYYFSESDGYMKSFHKGIKPFISKEDHDAAMKEQKDWLMHLLGQSEHQRMNLEAERNLLMAEGVRRAVHANRDALGVNQRGKDRQQTLLDYAETLENGDTGWPIDEIEKRVIEKLRKRHESNS